MENQQPYKQQFLAWFDSLSEDKQENFARDIIGRRKPAIMPEINPQDSTSRYSQTVLDAVKNHQGPSLMEFLLANRLDLPDDIDFSRPSGGAREDIEFD